MIPAVISYSDNISTIALIVSALSLFVSLLAWLHNVFKDRRDRPILKMRCEFYDKSSGGSGLLRVFAVNIGQRPVALRSLGAKHPGKESWYAFRLRDNELVRLDQNQAYEFDVIEALSILQLPSGSWAKSPWFEDSTGKRYHIKHSEKHIKKLYQE